MEVQIKELIATLERLRDQYQDTARSACSSGDTWIVYQMVRDGIATETKIRSLKNRFLSN